MAHVPAGGIWKLRMVRWEVKRPEWRGTSKPRHSIYKSQRGVWYWDEEVQRWINHECLAPRPISSSIITYSENEVNHSNNKGYNKTGVHLVTLFAWELLLLR